jgi:hypothetical protein
MGSRTQDAPGYYVWEVPGKPVAVHLHFDVLDSVLAEVMRGFGAVPKRGAEVGGVLTGVIEYGEQIVVRIDDFEAVECAYRRGPSYLLTEEDATAFADTCERWQPGPSRPAYAVGYFRSHTRDGLYLSPEDVGLLDRYFPDQSQIALLVKPFATKASIAGFFFREDGVFQDATPLEFPFRRRDLTGEEAPPRRALSDRGPDRGTDRENVRGIQRAPRQRPRSSPTQLTLGEEGGESDEPETTPAGYAYAIATPPRSRWGGLMWIPLSFIFLLLGVALGFQAATSMGTKARLGAAPDFSLELTVTKTNDNLTVRWNRDAPAIRNAQRGLLEIQDGSFSKSVELDAAHLQESSVIYPAVSSAVHFRLLVFLNDRSSLAETLDWQQ